jgi:hypothetical protein
MARFRLKTWFMAMGVLIGAICFAGLTPAASRADSIIDEDQIVTQCSKFFVDKNLKRRHVIHRARGLE